MKGVKRNNKAKNNTPTYNQGLTRKDELDRVRGFSTIVDPERGPSNK
ncbi:hypothetical protein [Desulfoscipio gibsoniae]|uniref:Uncharacterized protein n=1 Tax=Desulfoscipio gibsoniae DSM 7213 TaxID=767817 RepID=R4KR64_9FIRM|nr:hypothetical protein [Desulfoscipio gibsoniae]AGL03050.1 hypothetical protein Desgi_3728 [Desulfoscipio gibsoniae DSM 7213]